MQKLYCYVDETGQDSGSEVFIVVAVVNSDDQDNIRTALVDAERFAETNTLKWHKSKHDRRMKYLRAVVEKGIAAGSTYFKQYRKPIPYSLRSKARW